MAVIGKRQLLRKFSPALHNNQAYVGLEDCGIAVINKTLTSATDQYKLSVGHTFKTADVEWFSKQVLHGGAQVTMVCNVVENSASDATYIYPTIIREQSATVSTTFGFKFFVIANHD